MTTFTFTSKKLVDCALAGPDSGVYYSTSSTTGAIRGRKITTIRGASGLVGMIDWKRKTFSINGVEKSFDDEKPFDDVCSGGFLTNWRGRSWQWTDKSFKVESQHMQKEILATSDDMGSGVVRFASYEPHLISKNEAATIRFPYEMQDEIDRLLVLMAILQPEMHEQDIRKSAESADVAVSGLS
ncbi:hypothetical protein C8F01DRAFT_1373308 [Mycena amicta]|nr:hypothetical protein C8F01DRAFT_1373308 [Mycena amicta]